MWTENLVARFNHRRSSSSLTQGAPLMAPEGPSRPLSTISLDPVAELENERPCDAPTPIPATTNSQPEVVPVMPVTATAPIVDEKATSEKPAQHSHPIAPKPDASLVQVAHDIEAFHSLGMRSIRSFFMEEIDTAQAAAPLSAYCFMTGFMYVFVLSISPLAHPVTQRCSILFCNFRLVCLPDWQLCTSTALVDVTPSTRSPPP